MLADYSSRRELALKASAIYVGFWTVEVAYLGMQGRSGDVDATKLQSSEFSAHCQFDTMEKPLIREL